ncbi:MAG TPA: hypothetical protein VHD33_04520 [Legionellaceae bacterium]|nr:hypothetical protein [Legionellaceae bacterium]
MPTQYKGFKERFKAVKTPVSSAINAVKTTTYIAGSYAMSIVGLDLGTQVEKSIDQFFSPRARANLFKDNIAGLKVKGLIPSVKQSIQSLETHLKVLEHPNTGFEELKNKLHMQSQDTRNSHQNAAKNQLNQLITIEGNLRAIRYPSFDINEIQKRFEVLKDILERDDVEDPRTIPAYVDIQLKALAKHIKDKKASDLQAIERQMNALRNGINHDVLSIDEITKLEQTLIKTLNETYDKFEAGIKKDFEEGVPAAKQGDTPVLSIKNLMQKEADKAEAELFNLVLFSEKTKSKEVVDANPGALGAHGANKGKKYRSITFEEYVQDQPRTQSLLDFAQYLMNNKAEIYGLGGLRIKHDGQGGISMTIPHGLSLYYHYQDRLLGADIMSIVNQIKAQGKEEITLTLDVHDAKLRQKIMEEFYYAATLAGFPPDKIKFNVTYTEDPEKSISNKTASEIMGRLGQAPQRAGIKQQIWQQEQAEVDKESKVALNRRVAALDQKIENILNQPPLQARATI